MKIRRIKINILDDFNAVIDTYTHPENFYFKQNKDLINLFNKILKKHSKYQRCYYFTVNTVTTFVFWENFLSDLAYGIYKIDKNYFYNDIITTLKQANS